jgi:GTPase SAR1 family protein
MIKVSLFTELIPMVFNSLFSFFKKDLTGSPFIEDGDGFLIVYDVTNRVSFDVVEGYASKIRKIKGGVPIILIGTKCDLEDLRQISKEEGEEKSKTLGVEFYEVSKFITLNDDLFHLLEFILESKKVTDKVVKEDYSEKKLNKKECTFM